MDGKLIYFPCKVQSKLFEYSDRWICTFNSTHNHPIPPHFGRLPDQVQKELSSFLDTTIAETALQLKMKKTHREAISSIHPSLGNAGKVRYERKKHKLTIGNSGNQSSIGSILSFFNDLYSNKNNTHNLLQSNSIHPEDAHITMIDEGSKKIIEANEFPYQTDSVHDFVDETSFINLSKDSDEVNVTLTSTYDKILQKAVPVVISIMFGKTSLHYKCHFLALFKNMKLQTSYDDFMKYIPGNTCDFSDAERDGFFNALQEHIKMNYNVNVDHKDLLHLYRFCEVHSKRSFTRILKKFPLLIEARQKSV